MKPTVLFVHPDASLRGFLSRSLARRGYEVAPAIDEAEGIRFAEALQPVVIVASADLAAFGDGSVLERVEAGRVPRTLVLLGGTEQGTSAAAEGVYSIPDAGLEPADLARKVGTLLLAREVGLSSDDRFEALVGDVALTPFLELLHSLRKARVSGVLQTDQGWLALVDGDVVAAASGSANAAKAFLRLARHADGPLRLVLGTPDTNVEIDTDFEELIGEAIEASLGDQPDPRMLVEVQVGPALFKHPFTNRQRRLLSIAHRAVTVENLLDALPDPDHEIIGDLHALQSEKVIRLNEPELQVQIVTDSTCDLPDEHLRRLGIRVVPLYVFFGDDQFLDGVDLKPREFFQHLDTRPEHPRTQPPAIEDFRAVYGEVARHRDILSIHISSVMSDTAGFARAAARDTVDSAQSEDNRNRRIEVVDSESVSLGLGLMAIFAARMARRGMEFGELRQRLERMPRRLHALFVVASLDSLARGGRIGKAQAWVGSLLGIKPILEVAEGEIRPLARVRRLGPAQKKLVELLEGRVDPKLPVVATISHARAPLQADRVRTLLQERFDAREIVISDMGPVVGTHTGPGTVAVVLFQPEEDEWPWLEPLA